MKSKFNFIVVFLFFISSIGFAGTLPLTFTSQPTPQNMVFGTMQTLIYTIKNNIPLTVTFDSITGYASPITRNTSVTNNCGSTLAPNASCNIELDINPTQTGPISNQVLTINYSGRYPLMSHPISINVSASPFAGIIGADYAPGHYDNLNVRNDENQANVYFEMKQLKSAGFNTVRLYGDPGKTWVQVIRAADQLNMSVIYEVALCESNPNNGDQCVNGAGTFNSVFQTSLVQLNGGPGLKGVIQAVGATLFKKVVKLVLVGNEVLFTSTTPTYVSNRSDIISAIQQVRQITDPLGIPVSISLQADVWVSTNQNIKNDLNLIVAALSPNVSIGINVYPFQWVVPVANSVSDASIPHSLAWYLNTLKEDYQNNPVLIAETGWATAGLYIVGMNNTSGDPNNSQSYLSQLYSYVKSNNIPLLTFMAFDTPTKDLTNPNLTSENFYGVFDKNCQLKNGGSTLFLPNTAYIDLPQCATTNAIFTFAGGSNTAQPPFTIMYTHNADTRTLNIATENRLNQAVTPWPTITLNPGDSVTLSSATPGTNCTNTVATTNANNGGGTWTQVGPGLAGCPGVNWANGQTVFLPANF